MFAIERRLAIARLVNENGSVSISELSRLFGMSAETLRKDLLVLEKEKVLERTHGGAVRISTPSSLRPLQERRSEHLSQKRELCTYAMRFIRNGDVIALDEGSTSAELARLLSSAFTRLTVATHSLEIFHILEQGAGIEPILCGGRYIREESAFAGPMTQEAIRRLHVDKFFVFPSSITLRYGLTEHMEPFVAMAQTWMERADQVFVLAYSERFENRAAPFKLADPDSSMIFITDSGLSDDIIQQYHQRGLTLIKEDQP